MPNNIIRTIGAAIAIAPAAIIPLAGNAAASSGHRHHDERATTVFTQTNDTAGNAVLALRRVDGNLTNVASYPTGGLGTGGGLGSQGAIATDDDHLIAVNAGSNELSLFRLGERGGLRRTDVEASNGVRPVSVTIFDDTVYVLNAGSRSVDGFRIRHDQLVPIKGSHQSLPGDGGAQISFDRTGRRLVVTEKATNTIDVLPVRHGVAGAATSNPSVGMTPFGFAIDDNNNVIVSNAAGGAAGASSLSSYRFTGRSTIAAVSPTVATTQTAACWVALSEDGRFAFTTNAGSGSVSSYSVGNDGTIALASAVAASTGASPVDMIVEDGVLYTLNSASHTITAHDIASNGSLTSAGQVSVPAGVNGLASN
ncbi:MAG: beta-propeller fold lactonase family protein [Acidimicrobiia bacterium]